MLMPWRRERIYHLVHAGGQQAPQVHDLTGSGADAVFDFVGEDSTISDSVAMLRPGAPTTRSAMAGR
jgi:threonine dehydrogenase-like Zn-dependent dehydrogenase